MTLKRRSEAQPDAILVADIHMRESAPVCRTDDFIEAMKSKIVYLASVQRSTGAPILAAGDIFDKWLVSPELLEWCIRYWPDSFHAIPGQHDMPQHNLDLLHRSAYGVMQAAGKILEPTGLPFSLDPYPFGCPLPNAPQAVQNACDVVMIHRYTWLEPDAIGKPDQQCTELFRRFPQSKLILTGDNHQQFVAESTTGQWLVNPGSMCRTTVAQKAHRPAYYFWFSEGNRIERHEFPISEGVIDDSHIRIPEEKSACKEAFYRSLSGEVEGSIDFLKNLETSMNTNNVSEGVRNVVEHCIDSARTSE